MRPSGFQTTPEPPPRRRSENTCTVDRRRRSAISPNPRMSTTPAPLPYDDVNALRNPAARYHGRDRLPDGMGFEHGLNIVRIGHRGAAQRGENVANQDSGLGCRSLGLER